mgnify:CR=1 FL=1
MNTFAIPWRPQSMGVAATAAFAVIGSALTLIGTGSVYNLGRTEAWRPLVKSRVPFIVDVVPQGEICAQHPDVRTAAQHLSNIRQVLNPAISDLSIAFGVSRQAIYKWLGDAVTPEPDKFARIVELSHVADAFRDAGVSRGSALLKMKAFDGRSLLDLLLEGPLRQGNVQALIAEASAMEKAYGRSVRSASKAKPTTDWQSSVSIPGSAE